LGRPPPGAEEERSRKSIITRRVFFARVAGPGGRAKSKVSLCTASRLSLVLPRRWRPAYVTAQIHARVLPPAFWFSTHTTEVPVATRPRMDPVRSDQTITTNFLLRLILGPFAVALMKTSRQDPAQEAGQICFGSSNLFHELKVGGPVSSCVARRFPITRFSRAGQRKGRRATELTAPLRVSMCRMRVIRSWRPPT